MHFDWSTKLMCFHSAMKYENDVSNMVGCLQVMRSYSFMKEVKYTYAHCLYCLSLCYD